MPPPKTVFSAHERNALRDRWGAQATRLTRDSFLPFGSCQLCLLPSVNPVCCPSGDLFCRECAMTNILAQRQEIKRLERLALQEKAEEEDQKACEAEDARLRSIEEFEAVQMGLSKKGAEDHGNGVARGIKRRRSGAEDDEAKRHLPFWMPSELPENQKSSTKAKANPICPSSDSSHSHVIALKTLTDVNFHEEKSIETQKMIRTCPSCQKTLSNSLRAVLTVPCGHVLCKPCVGKFLTPEHRHHRDAHDDQPEPASIHCYVCDAELSPKEARKNGKDGKKKKDKGNDKVQPGLVEIRSEGTGFASGGKAMVKKEGVAFST